MLFSNSSSAASNSCSASFILFSPFVSSFFAVFIPLSNVFIVADISVTPWSLSSFSIELIVVSSAFIFIFVSDMLASICSFSSSVSAFSSLVFKSSNVSFNVFKLVFKVFICFCVCFSVSS